MTDHEVRVWDPLVRVFHWSLVATFAIAWLSGDEESLVHAYAGYVIIGLLAFRLLWGFIGSRYARFSDFLYSPRRTLQYLKSLRTGTPEAFLGHNPAGGWMIVLLLVSLALASYTGLKAYGVEGHGPLAGADGRDSGVRAMKEARSSGKNSTSSSPTWPYCSWSSTWRAWWLPAGCTARTSCAP
jgi:cytochrome b